MGVRSLAAALLAGCVLAGCGGGGGEPADAGQDGAAEEVTFTTEDGAELRGLRYGSGDTAVVLAHMHGSNKDAWSNAAEELARNGVVAFPFDFRYSKPGPNDTTISKDLLAAIVDARARGAAKVFVVGASMGGVAALAVAADQKLDGVVAVSAPLELGAADGVAAAPKIEEPSLFIAAREDGPYADYAEQMSSAAGGRLQLFDGAAHGTDFLDSEHRDAFMAALIDFVKDPPAPAP